MSCTPFSRMKIFNTIYYKKTKLNFVSSAASFLNLVWILIKFGTHATLDWDEKLNFNESKRLKKKSFENKHNLKEI